MKSLKNQKGIALLVVLFAVIIMVFLAVEVGYNSHVELVVGSSQLDRLRASYLAKSGVQLSLLRINVYKFAMQKFGPSLGANKNALDVIWQFPFAWPPMLPDEVSSVDKENLKSIVKKSYIEGAFSTSIESEGAKIDVNDLGSPSENLRKAVYNQLVQIIQNRLDQDDDWARDHRDTIKPTEVVNNIADWIDEDSDGLNGGSEASGYSSNGEVIPPANRSLKTLDELHMIKGVTDDVYGLLAPRLTVYGVKGIKVNLASAEVLKSLDKQITDEVVKEIIKRRSDPEKGPFQSVDDFTSFIQGKGVNLEKFNKSPEIPLLFDAEYNFRIKSTGIFRKAQREIIAIVYDFDKVKGQLSSLLASPGPSASPSPGSANPGAAGAGAPEPSPSPSPGGDGAGETNLKVPPQVIFWQEY